MTVLFKNHTISCWDANKDASLVYKCICTPVAPVGFESDPINHPTHYTSHPSGVECIQVTEHMNFNLGNAVKYIWRAGLKSPDPGKDLLKAKWYICRELVRLGMNRGKEDSTEELGASPSPAKD